DVHDGYWLTLLVFIHPKQPVHPNLLRGARILPVVRNHLARGHVVRERRCCKEVDVLIIEYSQMRVEDPRALCTTLGRSLKRPVTPRKAVIDVGCITRYHLKNSSDMQSGTKIEETADPRQHGS